MTTNEQNLLLSRNKDFFVVVVKKNCKRGERSVQMKPDMLLKIGKLTCKYDGEVPEWRHFVRLNSRYSTDQPIQSHMPAVGAIKQTS